MDQQIDRILIVRTDRIGDVILTLPMASILKKHFPAAHISMMIRRYTAELVENHPTVDQMLFYDDGKKPVPLRQLVATLRRDHYDVVFHTHPRFRVAFITWLAGIPVRVGTGYRWYSFLFNWKVYEHRKDALHHELEYNLNLVKAIHCPVSYEGVEPRIRVDPGAAQKIRLLLGGLGIREEDKIVILHPGSGGSARDWSAERFGALGNKLSKLPGVAVVVTGSRGEARLVDTVKGLVGSSASTIVDQLNLKEYAALTERSSLFISNSTGTIHIAAAVGTPVIGLYSQLTSLSAARWGPYTKRKTIFSPVGMPRNCNKCRGGKIEPCECMETIPVDEVYRAAMHILDNRDMEEEHESVNSNRAR